MRRTFVTLTVVVAVLFAGCDSSTDVTVPGVDGTVKVWVSCGSAGTWFPITSSVRVENLTDTELWFAVKPKVGFMGKIGNPAFHRLHVEPGRHGSDHVSEGEPWTLELLDPTTDTPSMTLASGVAPEC